MKGTGCSLAVTSDGTCVKRMYSDTNGDGRTQNNLKVIGIRAKKRRENMNAELLG